jgi:hypothetical protein
MAEPKGVKGGICPPTPYTNAPQIFLCPSTMGMPSLSNSFLKANAPLTKSCMEQRWRQRNGRKAEQSKMRAGREWDLRENRDGVRMGRERAGLRVSWRKKMSRDRGTESWREKFQKNGFCKGINCSLFFVFNSWL